MDSHAAWVDSDLAHVEDPDRRALLAALRGAPPAEWPAEADGPRLELLAHRNRVSGVLRGRIEEAGEAAPAWARGLRSVLQARALANGNTNRVKADAIREIGEAFAARGFEAVTIKGFHLSTAIYAHSHDRPFGDADLLVRKRDLAGAEEALLALGYRRGRAQSGPNANEESFVRELRPGLVLDVDLHWTLVKAFGLVREMKHDDEGTFTRSTPAFPGLRFPSREDAVVIATFNLVSKTFRPLGLILDFRELLRGADPAGVAARARATRMSTALSVAMSLASVIFGAVFPDGIAPALPRWQRALLRRLLKPEDLARPELARKVTARYVLKVLSQDGAKGVIRTLAAIPGISLRRKFRR